LHAAPVPTEAQLCAALPQFLGTIQQRPPAYSALKVEGQRSYDLARRGAAVELAERPVEIHRLEILRYAYPELELLIDCGSGTYIRSLGRDIATALGTGAVMSVLRRLAIGPFAAESALPTGDLSREAISQRLQPPLLALAALPKVEVSAAEQVRLENGQLIGNRWQAAGAEIAAVTAAGRLVAILGPTDAALLKPLKCFPEAALA
jgi:tRNA pseudouridine55 synthase